MTHEDKLVEGNIIKSREEKEEKKQNKNKKKKISKTK